MKSTKTMSITMTAFMTAILCILAPFSIPLSTVPISLGTFAVYLCAVILGARKAIISVILYIMIGLVGLPVFAEGMAGFGVLAGPTGGYLIGYLVMAFFTGFFAKRWGKRPIIVFLGMVLGTIGCYLIGTVWLGLQLKLGVSKALMAGVIPFIPGDIIKMICCTAIALPIKKQINAYLESAKD
ncbi:biotin transporter BioY [Lachnoclostridium phytofermentans]|uniref:Biotin transporter n=1 Tax=Lachnoclostridium phytofermentans (strain ATCC 700394 / DSM 18823 / ISDg) TaxID=357809 RepID=A9KJK4_LACP7|nr:biotin transporter BioY [Lachnoclostridium phytofermentans]ABX44024.1 BioY protein [Lachnoclostridium phytofermentans ISDg]